MKAEEYRRIEDCVNFQLTQAQSKVNALFRSNLEAYGVTPAQYMILYFLWEEDGLSPSRLAEMGGLDASTITGLLTRMERKGLTKRKHSKDDRRGVNVYLTKEGVALRGDILRVIEESNKEALACLAPKERKAFKKALARIAENETSAQERK